MTTSTQPLIQAPRFGRIVNERGEPTQEFWRFLELLGHHVGKMDEAAREYTALNPATATTNQIATAVNTYMASAIET